MAENASKTMYNCIASSNPNAASSFEGNALKEHKSSLATTQQFWCPKQWIKHTAPQNNIQGPMLNPWFL